MIHHFMQVIVNNPSYEYGIFALIDFTLAGFMGWLFYLYWTKIYAPRVGWSWNNVKRNLGLKPKA